MVKSDAEFHSTNVKIPRELWVYVPPACRQRKVTLSMLVGQALNLLLGTNVPIEPTPPGRRVGFRMTPAGKRKMAATRAANARRKAARAAANRGRR